ncbi:TetR/AcrR family transcriptional regulator [Streptomyces sp. ODS28]|uniref:TetR/AcrR family transcriptional regulator n=1 Tax=Streptomyces sp. ODS28 TaxID=3136688 RepID=UPI0031EA641E
MPTARESLLEAAHSAVATQPWTSVRMVDVAAAAGVSRQTLYNEFGSKDGLGAALVNRLVEGFLDGAARSAVEAGRRGADPATCCAAAAAWMLRTARGEPIVRAALTGCWSTRMPLPASPQHSPSGSAAAPPGEPGRLAAVLRDRTVSGLASGGAPLPPALSPAALSPAYDAGLRVALSYVVAPADAPDDETCGRVGDVVRALLAADG